MDFFKFLLISFVILATLIINKNTFSKQINNKGQKALELQNNKVFYRLMRDKSRIISKNKNMNPNVYIMLSRIG
jgi:hypothetical protein